MTTQTVLRPYRVSEDLDGAMIDRPPAADDVLREMTELLRDARPGMLVSGFTVPAVTVGVAIEEALLSTNLHTGFGSVLSVGLLAVLALTVIRTAILTLLAGRLMLDQLGELRREIGAPVDPTVPWTPMRNLTAVSEAPGWDRMRAIVAAAHYYSFRSHQALTWATLAIICFFIWTLVTVVVA